MPLPMIAPILLQLAVAGSPGCTAAVVAAPGKTCVATAHGVVLAPDQAEATRLAQAAAAGEQRFVRHFRRPPPPFALLQDGSPDEQAAVRAAGFARVLPYLTPARFQEAQLASARRAAETQAKANGLTPAATAAVVEKAEAALRSRTSVDARHRQDEGVVPHELGHLWYVELFWPRAAGVATGHYGGPGPDWMDETAAVLMESDALAADRRRQFAEAYRGTGKEVVAEVVTKELVDLTRFLSRDHPTGGRSFITRTPPPGMVASPAGAGSPSFSGIRVISGDEARQLARGGLLFYLQSRLFADYLVERTGDPAIFADIGGAFGRGETMASWLKASGGARKLPSTLAALDADWRAWLTARLGPPATG